MSTIQNFDPAGAAKWLGVSKSTVRLMLKDGRLPYSRVGRRVVIQLADLEALLASTRVAVDAAALSRFGCQPGFNPAARSRHGA